jgi:CDP-diglyceride synthetase
MSPLVWMGIVWGVVTALLVILLIYRSTLTMHEDDQLFLDEAESHMEQEQIQLMKRVNMISPYLKVLGALSGAMILVMAGMAIYQGLNQPQ